MSFWNYPTEFPTKYFESQKNIESKGLKFRNVKDFFVFIFNNSLKVTKDKSTLDLSYINAKISASTSYLIPS